MSGEPIPAIGTLTDRIQIRRRETISEDEGGHSEAFVPITTVWGRVRPLPARQAVLGDARSSVASHAVVMRYRPDIHPRDRLVYRGRPLIVLSAEDMNGRRAYLKCLCTETRVTG